MRCPSCDAEVPGRDLVCSDCGAFVYRDVPPAPREPEIDGPSIDEPARRSESGHAWFTGSAVRDEPAPGPPTSPQVPAVHRSIYGSYSPGAGGPDYVHPTLHGWPGLGPEPQSQYPVHPNPTGVQVPGPQPLPGYQFQPAVSITPASVNEQEMRKRGRTFGKWSIGLAVVALLIPIVGPAGIVTGYLAWRLGETRLGRIGVVASIAAMLAGVALALLVAPPRTS